MGLSGTYLGIVVCLLSLMASIELVAAVRTKENLLNNFWGICVECEKKLDDAQRNSMVELLREGVADDDIFYTQEWVRPNKAFVNFRFKVVDVDASATPSQTMLASNAKQTYTDAINNKNLASLKTLCSMKVLRVDFLELKVNDGLSKMFIDSLPDDAFHGESTCSTSQPSAPKDVPQPSPEAPTQNALFTIFPGWSHSGQSREEFMRGFVVDGIGGGP
eukprot:GHVS01004359.1.p1 GENE.GHVS01004359.1~~GHVS01004359.1.p1  ORF type:complete len:219 (+),score=21.00 GHVS01004359.1:181-837(+)